MFFLLVISVPKNNVQLVFNLFLKTVFGNDKNTERRAYYKSEDGGEIWRDLITDIGIECYLASTSLHNQDFIDDHMNSRDENFTIDLEYNL